MTEPTYNPSTRKEETRGSEIQDHLHLDNELEASLEYMRPHLKTNKHTQSKIKQDKIGHVPSHGSHSVEATYVY